MSIWIPGNQNHLLATLFLIVFSIYLYSACPTVYWLDSGEYLAALDSLGLAHSPSFPSYILTTKPFIWLPFGDVAWRGNLGSVFFGSLIPLLVFFLLKTLLNFSQFRFLELGIIVIASISVAFNQQIWYQALKAEVYSLHICLVLGILIVGTCLLNSTSNGILNRLRYWLILVFILSIAACNHLLLTAHLAPACMFLLIMDLRHLRVKHWLAMLLVFLSGISLYIFLPIRSHQNPAIDLGNPENAFSFLLAFTRRGSYGRFFGNDIQQWIANLQDYWQLTTAFIPVFAVIIAGIGVFYFFLKKTKQIVFILLALMTNVAVTLMNRNFNATPDTGQAYLMLATILITTICFLFVVKIVVHICKIKEEISSPFKYGLRFFIVLLVAAMIWNGVHGRNRIGLHNDYSAHRIVSTVFEVCQPDAFFFTGFYTNLRFVLSYLQISEQMRTDINIIDRAEILYWPGGLQQLLDQFPGSAYSGLKNEEIKLLLYLAPRSLRNASPIPENTAKPFLLSYLSNFARLQTIFRSVYWVPSEDDLLLGKHYSPFFFILYLEDLNLDKTNDFLNNQRLLEILDQRILLPSIIHQNSLGKKTLRDLYINCGHALLIANQTKQAEILYEKARKLEERQ